MIYDIRPYVGAGPLSFGMSESEVEAILGEPCIRGKNRQGERDLQYHDLIVRFSRSGTGMAEVGFLPKADVRLDGIAVFDDPKALQYMARKDGEPWECVGFLVFLKLGLTLTGFHDDDVSQRAVTLFERGRWDDLRSEMRRFPL